MPDEQTGADARYELRESASFAFLLALEALTPPQRAVLLLRDVLDYSVRETAGALGMSEINVKVDPPPRAPRDGRLRPHAAAPRRALHAEHARRPCSGSSGAALRGRGGRRGVPRRRRAPDRATAVASTAPRCAPWSAPIASLRFFLGLQRKLGAEVRVEPRTFNGTPALVVEYEKPRARWAPRLVARCEVDAHGQIRELHLVLASRKLTGLGG